MNSEEKNTNNLKSQIFEEKDVLGQPAPNIRVSGIKAKPNRIFIVVGIMVLIAVLYWIFKR